MNFQHIVVVGASAGGFEALKELTSGLPHDFAAPIFIVWHMSPDVRGVLPQVLNRMDTLPAAHAFDLEPIKLGRIYIAPPDHHMLVNDGEIRVTRGPKENRFRPAIDPLFRSAAYHYGDSVIGIVLSGALDDGTSGLWTIKQHGGTAIVQDPNDAEVPSMPENAIREVNVDYTVTVAEMPQLLMTLLREKSRTSRSEVVSVDETRARQLELELKIAAEESGLDLGIMDLGELTPYTCPECHGVLTKLTDGNISRFRCHTGHAFTADSLLATVTEHIEESVWSAVRGVDESIILLNHMGDHFAEINQPRLAAVYFRKANEARSRNELLRRAVISHEQLSGDSLREESFKEEEDAIEVQHEMSARSDH